MNRYLFRLLSQAAGVHAGTLPQPSAPEAAWEFPTIEEAVEIPAPQPALSQATPVVPSPAPPIAPLVLVDRPRPVWNMLNRPMEGVEPRADPPPPTMVTGDKEPPVMERRRIEAAIPPVHVIVRGDDSPVISARTTDKVVQSAQTPTEPELPEPIAHPIEEPPAAKHPAADHEVMRVMQVPQPAVPPTPQPDISFETLHPLLDDQFSVRAREESGPAIEISIGRIEFVHPPLPPLPPPLPQPRVPRGFASDEPRRRYLDRRWY